MKKSIKDAVLSHQKVAEAINDDVIENISSIIEQIINVLKRDGTIFWCGNGGSAAQANHLSAEMVGGMFKEKNEPLKSICLNVDTSFITAWSNDDSFNSIFTRQIQSLCSKNDIVIMLSTSGNSENLILAADYCKKNNVTVVSFTGNDGGKLISLSDYNIHIESDCTQRIQEMHILIGHIICAEVENYFKK